MPSQQMSRESTYNFAALLLTACVLVAVYVLSGWQAYVDRAKDAAAWPRTEGVVTASVIGKRCGRGQSNLYYPDVRYTYQAEGRSFQNSTIVIGVQICGDEGVAREVAERYVPGAPVEVWYDPANLASATLTVGEASDRTLSSIHSAKIFLSFAIPAAAVLFYMGRRGW